MLSDDRGIRSEKFFDAQLDEHWDISFDLGQLIEPTRGHGWAIDERGRLALEEQALEIEDGRVSADASLELSVVSICPALGGGRAKIRRTTSSKYWLAGKLMATGAISLKILTATQAVLAA
jgi:hypothetical protein